LHLSFTEDDITELFVVKSATAVGVINSEEVLKLAGINDNSHLSDSFLESIEVDLTSVGDVKKLE
jgi:hypothetical protein